MVICRLCEFLWILFMSVVILNWKLSVLVMKFVFG